ncbi:MAG TPA: hypothetical protein VI306_08745 [Pyrinomonadaceae bacterium]
MSYIKARLLALLLIIIGAGLVYVNWHQLNTEHTYSMKIAAFAPLCIVGGLFLFVFPSKVGKPTTTGDKVIVFVVFIIGLLVGLVNWYLMDPGFFGQ